MLSFFPQPYPDESLYSILARYHLRSGNTGLKLTMQELFDVNHAIATADLPCNLDALVGKLSLISTITVEDLVQKHTLYPFYAAFLPQARSQQVLEAMRSKDGNGIHDRVGIRASLVTVPRYFRFCPQCIQNDQKTYGELYWHRVHQVPGVLVCPHHAKVLQESTVPIQGLNRHAYIAADRDHCTILQSEPPFSPKALNLLHLLAQDVCFLLENTLPSKDLHWFRQQYMAHLIDCGLATATGRVHQGALLGQFLCFYGRDVLEAMDSRVSFKEEHSWLTSIVRQHRKTFHPIRHLLMLRFLGIPVAEFFQSNRGYQPFGTGPWLCLNAAAAHHLKPVVTHLEISLCCDTKKPVGTFSCSCGFIYCRTGPDQTEADTRRIGKIKVMGSVWEQKLRHLIEIEQLGLRATARRLQVDPRTIKRYVQRLGLTPKWRSHNESQIPETKAPPCPKSNDSNDLRTQHRHTWNTLREQHIQASKTALRRYAPTTYSWLYRYDREWLNQSSPPVQKPVYVNNRVDWQMRDAQILAQVQEAVQGLLAAEKPIRITISKVAKAIGQSTLIEQHLDQMPLTQAYLDAVTESVETYQMRRVRWAVKLLDGRGEEVVLWKVVRMAGLRLNAVEVIRAALEHEVYRASADPPY